MRRGTLLYVAMSIWPAQPSPKRKNFRNGGASGPGLRPPKNARSLSYALRAVPRPSTRPARPALEIMSHPSERSPPPPRFSSCLPAALKPGRTLLCPSRRPRPVRRNLHGPPPRSRARPQAMRRKLPWFRAPNQMALFPHPRSESFFLLELSTHCATSCVQDQTTAWPPRR